MTLRTAAIAALLLTLVVGATSGLLFLAAFQFRADWLADPAQLVAGGTASAQLLGWAAFTDLISYYLPTAVVAYALWRVLRPRDRSIADLSMLAALAYVLAGGAAATALATVGPMLMRDYAAGEADQAATAVAFGVLMEVVLHAIWQFLDALFLATWWIGTGVLLRREQPRFAVLSIVLGIIALLGGVLTFLELGAVTNLLFVPVFVLWSAWSVWLLVLLWRRLPPFGDPGPSPVASPP